MIGCRRLCRQRPSPPLAPFIAAVRSVTVAAGPSIGSSIVEPVGVVVGSSILLPLRPVAPFTAAARPASVAVGPSFPLTAPLLSAVVRSISVVIGSSIPLSPTSAPGSFHRRDSSCQRRCWSEYVHYSALFGHLALFIAFAVD